MTTETTVLTPQQVFDRMTSHGDVLLHALDAHAARQPDKLLLHYGDENLDLSYADFAARTRRMASLLMSQGVTAGDHVSVHSQNALITALSMFAIWRLGAVFAPINYNLRGGFLSYQVNDTAPKAIIADGPGVALINDLRADMPGFILIGPGGDVETYEADAPLSEAPPLGPDDTAAIIYTSGTTGPAKGVRLGHRWINQYCYTSRDINTAEDVVHCDLPLYHVGGAFNLFGRAVWTGCTTGLWDRFSASEYWARIAKVGASATTLLDVMIPHIMSQPESDNDAANTLNKVHIQPYTQRHQIFARRFGIDFITVGFGQTESGSVFSGVIDEFPDGQGTPEALWKGHDKATYRTRVAALGRPVFDGRTGLPKGIMGAPVKFFEAAAMDETDTPVQAGEVGQLCLRPRFPEMILQGYLNKPEATLKVLKNCWFHTGDAVRCIDAERNLFVFIDRMGGYFRVRGENVSSFEVESVILNIEGVRACAAVPIPAAIGEEDDIAVWIEAEPGTTLSLEQITAHTEAEMPRYMRPRHIRFIDALPITPTAKVEKYKLREQILNELKEVDTAK
ncbi:AMP-dependent synthetase and ligase [Sulfitobacter noctilucae]|uniref:AMP-binding protein n=1 Tax=Sulfitobacter noctilucae TaxID=1342302 RepID=UPI0004696A4C|nr:AMP-binding protein [Sulfitobacter noctilucae]KIN60566.1 AMP-dependent synthetase and ligase [Sulfitobacter noctilucae]